MTIQQTAPIETLATLLAKYKGTLCDECFNAMPGESQEYNQCERCFIKEYNRQQLDTVKIGVEL